MLHGSTWNQLAQTRWANRIALTTRRGGSYNHAYGYDQPLSDGTTAMQRTLILLKPDCVQRRLVGPILARFEQKGLRIVAMKLLVASRELAAKHYAVHASKPFYESLLSFLTAGPTVALVLEGREAVAVARSIIGATDGAKAAPGTIRGDFALSVQNNLVHGSDSPENAAAEIDIWFAANELTEWSPTDSNWIG